MPKTITGVAGAYVNTASVPVDSDIASALSVETPFQRLLNNQKSLYDTVTTTGVLALRSVTDIAGLRAVTGMVNGQVCYVLGYGVYQYVDPSSTADAAPYIIQPTVGTGRWVHELYSLLGSIPFGLVIYDGSTKIAASHLRRIQVGEYLITAGDSFTTTASSGSPADITGLTVSFNVEAGDIVQTLSNFEAKTSASQVFVRTRLDGTAGIGVALQTSTTNATNNQPGSLVHQILWTAPVAGTVTVRGQMYCSGGATGTLTEDAQISVRVVRP